MILVAIGRLHEHEIRMFEGHGVTMERGAARADVARKHDDLLAAAFVHGHFEARRSQDVPGLDGAYADAGRHFGGVVISQAPEERMEAVHFLLRVPRLDQRLASLRAPSVLTLRVLALQVRRILEDQLRQRNRRRRGEDRAPGNRTVSGAGVGRCDRDARV